MQLRHAVVIVHLHIYFKNNYIGNWCNFVMISSLSSKDITVTKCPPVIHTHLFKSNSSRTTVDDKYSFTRARNALASPITSIKGLEPPSYWYNLNDNGKFILCESFRLEDCVFLSIMKTCGLVRQKKVNRKTSISVEKDK